MTEWQQIITFISGGGLGSGITMAVTKAFVRSEARNELKEDIKTLHERIDNTVECKYCDRQHNDLNQNIKEIKEQNVKIYDALFELLKR